jgi:hypothetical protein
MTVINTGPTWAATQTEDVTPVQFLSDAEIAAGNYRLLQREAWYMRATGSLSRGKHVVEPSASYTPVQRAAAIQAAIADASAAGGGEVILGDAGNWDIAGTLTLASHVSMVLVSGAILRATTDAHVVQMKPGAALVGGAIDTSGVAGFTSAAVYFDGADRFGFDNGLHIVEGTRLIGANQAGRGVYMYAAAPGATSEYVINVRLYNVDIQGFEDGIRLEAVYNSGTASTFLNGNYFDHIWLYDCANFIRLTSPQRSGTGAVEANGNVFTNIAFQIEDNANLRAVYCDGATNRFHNAFIWDWHRTNSITEIEFSNTSHSNVFEGDALAQYVVDSGRRNTINVNHALLRQTTYRLREHFLPPGNSDIPQQAGAQDDYLVGANTRYTVTQTAGSAPTSGSIGNLFDNNPNTYAKWDEAVSTFPVTVEVDFGGDINYLDAVGINFLFSRSADEVALEVYKTADAEWIELVNTTGNVKSQVFGNTHAHLDYLDFTSGISKVRFTISGAGSESSDGTVYVERFWLFQSGQKPQTYLSALGGTIAGHTTVDGNLTADALIANVASALYVLHAALEDSGTANIGTVAGLERRTTGTPGVGFGALLQILLETNGGASPQSAGGLQALWADATNASRKGRTSLLAFDAAGSREGVRVQSNGSAPLLGFYGNNAVAQGSAIANADGALSDITTKFNALLAYLRTRGDIAP